jgi:hypothetical protein
MSIHGAWATWDFDDSASDPFRFGKDADHIRASLGLDPENWWGGTRLVLLVYKPPATLVLCRPTVSDAGLHLFFAPPPAPQEQYGLTKVWQSPGQKYDPLPRPESIHTSAPMGTIHRALTRDVR